MRRIGFLVLVIAGTLAYLNSLHSPRVLDDQLSIEENPQIRALWRSDVLFAERESPIAGRPLVNVTLAVNYALGGVEPAGYRIVNIGIHVLCALLVWALIRRTLLLPSISDYLRVRADVLAFAIALLWMLHPVNSEVINYITQRTEAMMAFFFLLTLYASVRAVAPDSTDESGSKRKRAERKGNANQRVWQGVAVIACALGMGCKESMVITPIMVVLFDRVFVFRSLSDAWRRRWAFYACLAATWLLLVALLLSGPRIHSAGFGTGISPWTYLLNQAVLIPHYLRLSVWPRGLVLIYGLPQPLTLGDVWPQALLVVIALAATAIAFIYERRLAFLGAWVFIALAPASSIVPIATEVGAERRMYLPLIAIITLVIVTAVAAWHRLVEQGRPDSRAGTQRLWAGGAATALVAAIFATATVARNREYSLGVQLAEMTLARWPSDLGRSFVARELMFAGRNDEAIPFLQQASATDARAQFALGSVFYDKGRLDEAIAELREFQRRAPIFLEVPAAHVLIGSAYVKQGHLNQAITEAETALAMLPHDEAAAALLKEATTRLGVSLVAAGRPADAVAPFRRIVAFAPEDPAGRRNLALALYDAGNLPDATTEAREAIRLAPADAFPHDLLGRALVRQGQLDAGLAELERAVELDPGDAEMQEHLAQARRLRQ